MKFIQHIEIRSGTCSGKPCIKGTRIKVENIIKWHYHMKLSLSEILKQYPHLTLADVYGALAFYQDNKEAIDADIQASSDFIEEMRSNTSSLLSEKIRLMKLAKTGFPEWNDPEEDIYSI